MPLAPTPCLEQDCMRMAVYQGRCLPHKKTVAFRNNGRNDRLPKDWNARRTAVLMRDGGVCHICGNAGADGVDHLINNDDNSMGNLAAVHDKAEPQCHAIKTAQEGHDARRAANRLPKILNVPPRTTP